MNNDAARDDLEKGLALVGQPISGRAYAGRQKVSPLCG